jgi:hypothetical protein
MTKISIQGSGGGASLDPGSLKIKNGLPIDSTLQTVSDVAGNDSILNISTQSVGIGTKIATGLLNLYKAAAAVRLMINGDAGQNRLISYRTAGLQRWGLYVTSVAETGSNAGSNFQIRRYSDAGNFINGSIDINRATGIVSISEILTLGGNELRNFIPRTTTENIILTIDSTNENTYNSSVLELTGAITVTFDASIRAGFNISVIQKDANQSTFATTGALTLRNRLGNTKTAGQWATVTLYKSGSDLILAGDTAL